MQNDPPSPRPTRHAEVMNRQPNRVSPRAGAQAGGMNAYDLSYRQSLIAVGALCLWLLTVTAAFYFLGPPCAVPRHRCSRCTPARSLRHRAPRGPSSVSV